MFGNFEGLNGLDFLWYGHNSVTSDAITQIVKFVGAKAWFAGIEFEPSLLEAGEHLFEDSNMFCPRDFCNMQIFIDVNTYCVQTNEELRHILLEDFGTVAHTHGESLILVLAPLGEDFANFF